ncbi:MAG: hypothetical protein E7C05_17190 [Clostridium botulinum]|uniref:hypothetical protein n=1 Tax=Clostridium sporogenes TaxID=1509 RepID=UPI001C60ABF0|nr:hypothetical protein [Clostridium sporogenes]MBW5458507.1 hypothetical protein [Clostridium sporogenes]MDU2834280.1 hypothetical protein [Clostridium botulinum]
MEETKVQEKNIEKNDLRECFVIMPIGDKEGYSKGHFKRVYEDIFKPAIEKAGFKAYRADDNNASHLIQLDIIKRIIEAPMAICDLSTRNPNVLFELGVRQAFDKPVVLVQEVGTEKIFDINSINTHSYKKERFYNEVLEDQAKISNMIKETFEKHNKGEGINSLINLIGIKPAERAESNMTPDGMMKVIFDEMMGIKKQLNEQRNYNWSEEDTLITYFDEDFGLKEVNHKKELEKIHFDFQKLKDSKYHIPMESLKEQLIELLDTVMSYQNHITLSKRERTVLANFKIKILEELKTLENINNC